MELSKQQIKQAQSKNMKNFIKQRRQQHALINQAQKLTSQLDNLMMNKQSDRMLSQFRKQQPELVYNYLLTQNELMKTPLASAFQQENWYIFIKNINQWSKEHIQTIRKKFQAAANSSSPQNLRNQQHFYLKNKFDDIIRVISARQDMNQQQLIELLSQQDTLLCQFVKLFLSYQNTVNILPEEHKLRMFQDIFIKVAQKLKLPSTDNIIKYGNLLRRQKIWKDKSFVGYLHRPQLLFLQELHYNFLHELIMKNNQKLIYQIIDYLIEEQVIDPKIDQIRQGYFCCFDSAGDTPVDILLASWNYKQIKKFIQKSKEIQYVHYSVNCLSKVIYNNKLNQAQVQQLIQQLINGSVSQRGYCERIIQQRTLKKRCYQGLITKQSQKYVLILDKRRLLMAKNKRQSYPLLNYLDRFIRQPKLKIVASLMFKSIQRQAVKSKVITLIKNLDIYNVKFDTKTQALKQVEQIIYYHEQLLNLICRLPHGDVLQYFVDKLYINYFGMTIAANTDGSYFLYLTNRHFLINYIQLHGDLSQNKLNKKIIDKIFQAKDNEKFVNSLNMYIQILRQFHEQKHLAKKDQWFVVQVKKHLKKHVKDLNPNVYFQFKTGEWLLYYLLPVVLSQQQIRAMKLPEDKIKKADDNRRSLDVLAAKKRQSKQLRQSKMRKYQNHRSLNNFQTQLVQKSKKLQQQAKNLQKQESQLKTQQKRQEEKVEEQNEGKQQQKQKEEKLVNNTWYLKLDEPQLQKKIVKLVNQGFKIQFNMFKKLVGNQKGNASDIIIGKLNDPWKTICFNMIRSSNYNQNHKFKSLQFHIACLMCQDQDVDKMIKFLQQAPTKFKQIASDWNNQAFNYAQINPFLLAKLIKSPKLSEMYKIQQPQTTQTILQIVENSIRKIVYSLKSTIPQNHCKKLLTFKKIIQILDKNKKWYQTVVIREYMQMHSQKVDLSEFYKQVQIQEIFLSSNLKIYVNKLKISKNPIKELLQMIKLIQKALNQEKQRKKEQNDQDQDTTKTIQGFKIINQHRPQIPQFCAILDGLNEKDFNAYLQNYKPKTFAECRTLIQRLNDQKKCIRVLNYLIDCNNQVNNWKKQKQQKNQNDDRTFSQKVNSLFKNKFKKLNSALCPFVKVNKNVLLKSNQITQDNKKDRLITIQHIYFIDECNQQEFQIFIEFLEKMIKLGNLNYSEKQRKDIVTQFFTITFNSQNWKKATKIVQKVKQLSPYIKDRRENNFSRLQPDQQQQCSNQQDWIYQKKYLQISLDQQFLTTAFNLCAKNKERQKSYKQIDLYQKLIQELFQLLKLNCNQQNESIFESAWLFNPDKTNQIMKIEKLSLRTLASCIHSHPNKIQLIQRKELSHKDLPTEYNQKYKDNFMPFNNYDVLQFAQKPYLVDILIFEQKIKDIWIERVGEDRLKKYQEVFQRKKKSVFLVKQIMARFKEVYSQQEINKYSYQIFNSNAFTSLKQIPKQYLDAYFSTNIQIRGIKNLNSKIIIQIIQMGYINKNHIIDIIKTCNIDIIQYFLKKNSLKITYQLIQQIQKKNKIELITVLAILENQKFVAEFIKKYGIFGLYAEDNFEAMSRGLLWEIALNCRTTLLQIFIQYMQNKFNTKQLQYDIAPVDDIPNQQPIHDEQQKAQNQKYYQDKKKMQKQNNDKLYVPKHHEKGGVKNKVVYLPLRVAAASNFYQYYFLLMQTPANFQKQQQQNMFKPSLRFNNKQTYKVDDYKFIPEMHRKLGILQSISQYYETKQINNLKQLYKNTLVPAILLDSKGTNNKLASFLVQICKDEVEVPVPIGEQPTRQIEDGYINMYLIILLLKTMTDAEIKDQDLIRFYPEETKLVNYVLSKYKFKVTGHQNINRILHKHQHLRSLVYSSNPSYLFQQLQSKQQPQAHKYSYPFTLQIRYFQKPEFKTFLEQFIHRCFYSQQVSKCNFDNVKPFQYDFNDQMMKHILIGCVVSCYEGNKTAFAAFCKGSNLGEHEMLISAALVNCINKAMISTKPLQEQTFAHNPAFWNSCFNTLYKMQKIQPFTHQKQFKPFFYDKFAHLINFEANKQVLQKLDDGLLDVYACFVYLSSISYIISEQRYLNQFIKYTCEQYTGDKQYKLQILLGKQYQIKQQQKIQQQKQTTIIQITCPYTIETKQKVRYLKIDPQQIKSWVQKHLLLQNLQYQPELLSQQEGISKMSFVVDKASCNQIKSVSIIRKLKNWSDYSDSVVGSITKTVEKLNQLVQEQKETRIYSLSDVSGPIVINDDTDKTKVIECLGFYQISTLPDLVVNCVYVPEGVTTQNDCSALISDIKQYIRYFSLQINDDQQTNKTPYTFSSRITFSPKKSDPNYLTLNYSQFAPYNIIKFLYKINRSAKLISSTFNDQINLKYSVPSMLKIVELRKDKIRGGSDQLFYFLEGFLEGKRNMEFVENLIIMILEDANNIMKVVKGILFTYDYDTKPKLKDKTTEYNINDTISIYGIDYKIDDQVFKVSLKVGPPSSPSVKQIQPFESNLISRKQFLNTVFSSTQFLTSYFINKSKLADELVRVSKQISNKINFPVSFSINYNQLYRFVDKIKESMSIRDIDSILSNLNNFINNKYKEFIIQYINSKQLAVQHQIQLISYFEKLFRNDNKKSSKQASDSLQFQTKLDASTGIKQIYNLSAQLKSSSSKQINIKNTYLIQIYKSYFASVVRQGMTFILGYKSNRPPILIQLQKKQDIDKINITEISFLLLVSNRVPTNDEIPSKKIIKIFVTDLNQIMYQVDKTITKKLLQLGEESDQRVLAHVVPILQPNVILIFNSEYSNDQKQLVDDSTNIYMQLDVNKEIKFKLKTKNKVHNSCIDILKIDIPFSESMKYLIKTIKSYINQNLTVRLKVPSTFDPVKAIQIFTMTFADLEQIFNNLFIDTIRNQNYEYFMSVQKGQSVRQNMFLKLKKKLFAQLYNTISIQISPLQKASIKVTQKCINLKLESKINHQVNSAAMTDVILRDQIQKILKINPKLKVYEFQLKKEDYFTILEHLIIGSYQIEQIQKANWIANKLGIGKISDFIIRLKPQQKNGIKVQNNKLVFTIYTKASSTYFFTELKILQFLLNKNRQIIQTVMTTKYLPESKQIQLINPVKNQSITLVLVNSKTQKVDKKQIKPNQQANSKRTVFSVDAAGYDYYFIWQKDGESVSVVSNYFWNIDKDNLIQINGKKISTVNNKNTDLYLVSQKPIYMSQFPITAVINLSRTNKSSQSLNITKKSQQFQAQLKLLSKQVIKLSVRPYTSSTITLHLGQFKLINNNDLESVSIISTSGMEMVEENTKFVELIFRGKVIKPNIGDHEKRELNTLFNEPAEKVEIQDVKGPKKQKTAEEMVYIVNQNSRKFLTRAGELRIDVINVCDEGGNPINFNPNSKVYFKHLNISSEIIVPQINYQKDNMRVELKWTPTIRGPYQIFLNKTRLNPSYEIGVCAAIAQIKQSKVLAPKKTEICFAEQTECSIMLKDQFGNIYTQLQQAIINDGLMIDIKSSQVGPNVIKMKAEKIDKYGLKKIRFSFDDPTSSQEMNVKAILSINMEQVVAFQLKIKGQSLAQRRKNLQKDMQAATKRYYTQIFVSRNNFIQSLFKIAQKNLDKNFSVKFNGEQGIDAGGLKRQFYDMIGKQMKNPQNPFFIQTDVERHNEYFINPEILKNKKKLEYMSLFGKFLANSFINSYLIGINFSSTFIKLLYDDPITFQDMLCVVPKQQAQRYQFLSKADSQYIDDLQIYFSYVLNRKKGIEVQMIPNGKNIKVTKQNVNEYLNRLPEFLITQRYKQIMQSFKEGFESVLKIQVVRRWIRIQQFWCMTAGVKEITSQVVLSYINIQGGKETHHAWFRAYITEASKQILQGFLKFSSGSSSIDFYRSSKITVLFQHQGENPKKLPISHTCWKQIQIPAYKTYAIMKQLLNAAFLYCSEGFGFA